MAPAPGSRERYQSCRANERLSYCQSTLILLPQPELSAALTVKFCPLRYSTRATSTR